MMLPPPQKEALGELINIGYGRAARALSELTGERIRLEVPQVDVYFVNEIQHALAKVFRERIWSVHQFFSGPLKGNAMLLTDEKAARAMTRLIVREKVSAEEETTTTEEVLTEVGNIILQSALGSCGDLLEVEVKFSVPGLKIDSVDHLLSSATVQSETLQYALLIRTRFHIVGSEVTGYVMVILGVTSFTKLMEALDTWQKRQMSA